MPYPSCVPQVFFEVSQFEAVYVCEHAHSHTVFNSCAHKRQIVALSIVAYVHHHSTPPSPASAIEHYPWSVMPYSQLHHPYLYRVWNPPLGFGIWVHVCVWLPGRLVVPFLGFDTHVNNSAHIEPEFRFFSPPDPSLFGFVTNITDELMSTTSGRQRPHNSQPSKSMVLGTNMSSKNCILTRLR